MVPQERRKLHLVAEVFQCEHGRERALQGLSIHCGQCQLLMTLRLGLSSGSAVTQARPPPHTTPFLSRPSTIISSTYNSSTCANCITVLYTLNRGK